MSRPSFFGIYFDLAFSLARRSTCERLKVGCAITSADHRHVYGVGYNGGASGLENACESLEAGKCGHIHAEANAIINCRAARSEEKNVYVTHEPCAMCAKMLINLGGVKLVVYGEPYRSPASALLRAANIVVVPISEIVLL